MTLIYFRNPNNYIEQIKAVGPEVYHIAWDRGMLIKRGIEPFKFAKLHFGEGTTWDSLLVGEQGAMHIDQDHDMLNPRAVYPVWTGGEDISILEEMMADPIGDHEPTCLDKSIPVDVRPVFGQSHIVVIAEMPSSQIGTTRQIYRRIKELSEDYPDCQLYIHGAYSYRVIFGQNFAMGDHEPRTAAAKKKVYIPNGKEVQFERLVGQLEWVNVLGMSFTDLKDPAKRCEYNIRSALWASRNWDENFSFKSRASTVATIDPSPGGRGASTARVNPIRPGAKAQPGDKEVCNSCSLQDDCKYYRDGAVCSLPESEMKSLADYFQSRDSGRILDALGAVVGTQAKRVEQHIRDEEIDGETNPEVSKELNALFNNGVKLAKLVDPTLTKPVVQINNGSAANAHAVAQADPKAIAAQVVRALEDSGVKREDITPEMFETMLQTMSGVPVRGAVEK